MLSKVVTVVNKVFQNLQVPDEFFKEYYKNVAFKGLMRFNRFFVRDSWQSQ